MQICMYIAQKWVSTYSYRHGTHLCSCCCYRVAKSCQTVWDPMDGSMLNSSLLQYFPEFAEIHIRWIGDAI